MFRSKKPVTAEVEPALDPCGACGIGIDECLAWIANPAVRQHCCNTCKRELTHSRSVLE